MAGLCTHLPPHQVLTSPGVLTCLPNPRGSPTHQGLPLVLPFGSVPLASSTHLPWAKPVSSPNSVSTASHLVL